MNDDHDDNKPIPYLPTALIGARAKLVPIDMLPPVDWNNITPDPRLETLEASEDVTDAIELLLDGEQCRVCGHYHGGQGSCVTRHAFVPRSECVTCIEAAEVRR